MSGSEAVWTLMPEWFVREHEPLIRRQSHAESVLKLTRLLPPQFLAQHAQLLQSLRVQATEYETLKWRLSDLSCQCSAEGRLLAVVLILRASLVALDLLQSRQALAAEIRLWRYQQARLRQ